MKNLAPLVIVVALGTPLVAAEKPLAPVVQQALSSALQNERQAAIRYEAFAVKADEEGYRGAASLFRACAKAERIHASRFKAALKKSGAEIPAESEAKPEVRTTADNLQAAIAAEQRERDVTYREAIEVAKTEKNSEISKLFDVTRDTETEHANLLAAANRSLDDMKNERTYFVCESCGYTSDVRLSACPLCRTGHGMKEVN